MAFEFIPFLRNSTTCCGVLDTIILQEREKDKKNKTRSYWFVTAIK